MNFNSFGPLQLERIRNIKDFISIEKLKNFIKEEVDKEFNLLSKEDNSVDSYVVISIGKNKIKKVRGPQYEIIKDLKSGEEFIRYCRSIKYIGL